MTLDADREEETINITFKGFLEMREDMPIIKLPTELLGGRRFVRVRGTLNGARFHGYAGSMGFGQPVIILSNEFIGLANIKEGDEVTVELAIISKELPEQRVHPDLERALCEAGADLSALPIHERRQLLTSVNEAKVPEVREQRIKAVVIACLDWGGRRDSVDPEV